MSKKKTNKLLEKWWERILAIFFAVIILGLAAGWGYAKTNEGKIYPGVSVGSVPVGGLAFAEAEVAVQSHLDKLAAQGLIFSFRNQTFSVSTVAAASDPDLSYGVISYDLLGTMAEARAVGREGNLAERWFVRARALFGGNRVNPRFDWRQSKIVEILREQTAQFENPAKSAELTIEAGVARLTAEKKGEIIDYRAALARAQAQLSSLSFSAIPLQMIPDAPQVAAAAAESLLPAVEAVLSGGPVVAVLADKNWTFSRQEIIDLLEVRADHRDEGRAVFGFSYERFKKLIKPMVAEINIEPQEPKFMQADGRVVEFKPSRDGRSVDILVTWRAWEEAIIKEKMSDLAPVVVTVEPKQAVADVNDLGIVELIGVGRSSFAGSPANRRHNIRVGAEAVNGTLIPPDGEFSLLKALGNIDGSTGYLPELVIKGNKTVPEFGGGLCQIGTTVFRATLAAGLPITERRSHSYTVSYYFDDYGLPGTDATIYDPSPDYRFKNDTNNYVLIVTRIEDSELFFEFWGTKDGRQVEQSRTRIWDRVAPPPVKLIETLDLEPGVKKCTESPHAGLKAEFDYKVTYPNGEIKEESFFSQYRPWQEVCLVGVEKLSEPPEAEVLGENIDGADFLDATID